MEYVYTPTIYKKQGYGDWEQLLVGLPFSLSHINREDSKIADKPTYPGGVENKPVVRLNLSYSDLFQHSSNPDIVYLLPNKKLKVDSQEEKLSQKYYLIPYRTCSSNNVYYLITLNLL